MIIQANSNNDTDAALSSGFRQSSLEEGSEQSNIDVSDKKLSVLIVDDDKGVSGFLSALITETFDGANVTEAHDGFEAGIKIRECEPDLVLVDLMMPGLGGFELCENIKSSPDTSHIRVIAMTGYPLEEDISQIMAAGAEACLTEPFESKDLFSLLGMIVPPEC